MIRRRMYTCIYIHIHIQGLYRGQIGMNRRSTLATKAGETSAGSRLRVMFELRDGFRVYEFRGLGV